MVHLEIGIFCVGGPSSRTAGLGVLVLRHGVSFRSQPVMAYYYVCSLTLHICGGLSLSGIWFGQALLFDDRNFGFLNEADVAGPVHLCHTALEASSKSFA